MEDVEFENAFKALQDEEGAAYQRFIRKMISAKCAHLEWSREAGEAGSVAIDDHMAEARRRCIRSTHRQRALKAAFSDWFMSKTEDYVRIGNRYVGPHAQRVAEFRYARKCELEKLMEAL